MLSVLTPHQQRAAEWESYDEARRAEEVFKCAVSYSYFINHYVFIFDAQAADWIPFDLWPEQEDILQAVDEHNQTAVLKARQLGISWLILAYILWRLLFRPKAVAMIFSRRDDEAMFLLSDERLKGMYSRLPRWMQAERVQVDSGHQFALSNGSIVYAFPTTAGDSYTASIVMVDEADLVPDLNKLLRSVKPTIDAGGKLILVSRIDKDKPNSSFKQIYRAAKQGRNGWACAFLPWYVRRERTQAWYEQMARDILARNGTLDELYEQYPATDAEALAEKTGNKRITPGWLLDCYEEEQPFGEEALKIVGAPAIPGLQVFRPPQKGRSYVMGADPAEGNPTSDDSALTVLDAETGEEVANLAGKFEPSTFGSLIDLVGRWYNRADVLVERNNHGHAVLGWLRDNSRLRVLVGDDNKSGWLDNSRGKTLLYANAAEAFRDGDTTVHSMEAYTQLGSIEGSTLRAPEGQNGDAGKDDRADSYALALLGRVLKVKQQWFKPETW